MKGGGRLEASIAESGPGQYLLRTDNGDKESVTTHSLQLAPAIRRRHVRFQKTRATRL